MLWIFAYGSLIWRPDFNHGKRLKAHVPGYERRFCQASHDHRGTAEEPGRVVTLAQVDDGCCQGLIYELATQEQESILKALDEREQDGYQRTWLNAILPDGQQICALTWIAGPENPSWRGNESIDSVARLIAFRHGPSGSNRQYLHRLDAALLQLGIQDEHVSHLAQLVRRLNPSLDDDNLSH